MLHGISASASTRLTAAVEADGTERTEHGERQPGGLELDVQPCTAGVVGRDHDQCRALRLVDHGERGVRQRRAIAVDERERAASPLDVERRQHPFEVDLTGHAIVRSAPELGTELRGRRHHRRPDLGDVAVGRGCDRTPADGDGTRGCAVPSPSDGPRNTSNRSMSTNSAPAPWRIAFSSFSAGTSSVTTNARSRSLDGMRLTGFH